MYVAKEGQVKLSLNEPLFRAKVPNKFLNVVSTIAEKNVRHSKFLFFEQTFNASFGLCAQKKCQTGQFA